MLDPQVTKFRALVSTIFARYQFLRQAGISFNGKRDLYDILGYDREITVKQYYDYYARGGIAGRVVDAIVDATWRGGVDLVEKEDNDPKNPTSFEKAWKDFDTKHQLRSKLQRVDKLSRLSNYSTLLIGVAEANVDLSAELPRGNGTPDAIAYVMPFLGGGGPGGDANRRAIAADTDCSIMSFETDPSSPRFGFPSMYQIRRVDLSSPISARPIHWSRLIHIAEGLLDNEVYGQPALERVWNLLADLDKVTGGGAEAFWIRASQGLHMNIDKDMTFDEDEDAGAALEELKKQSEDYQHQLTRWIRTKGVDVKQLGSDVANFHDPADAILTQIAGAKAIPKRILTGSEMGELASSQDRDNWKDQVNGRQETYAGPYILRTLADRLLAYNYLPPPSGGSTAYIVKWEHIQTLTEQERADGAAKWAEVNRAAGVTVFTAEEIREHWYDKEPITEESDQETWKADIALKMAEVNKTQGVTVFTSAEIRKTAYGWDPLKPEEEVPIGAPERISVTAPPPLEEEIDPATGLPKPSPAVPKPSPAPPAALPRAAEESIVTVLEAAIRSNNTRVIEHLTGLRLSSTSEEFDELARELRTLKANATPNAVPDFQAVIDSITALATRETKPPVVNVTIPAPKNRVTHIERDEKGLMTGFRTEEEEVSSSELLLLLGLGGPGSGPQAGSAHDLSRKADAATKVAMKSGKAEDHKKAADAHAKASAAHAKDYSPTLAAIHELQGKSHEARSHS